MSGQALSLGLDTAPDRFGDLAPGLESKGDPATRRLRAPGSDNLIAAQHRAGSAQHWPQLLMPGVIRDDQLSVLSLQEQVEATEQPDKIAPVIADITSFEHPTGVALDLDFHRIPGPVRFDIPERGVEEGRDVVRGGRPQETEVVPDGLQPFRR